MVFEGIDELGEFLARECGGAVRNGERGGRPGNLASGFSYLASIIAPDRRVNDRRAYAVTLCR